MSSIDSFAEVVRAALQGISEVAIKLGHATQTADELRTEFARIGAEDKAGQADAIRSELESQLSRAGSIARQAETALARTEAMRGGDRGGSGTALGAPPIPSTLTAAAPGYPHHKPHEISWSDLHHVLNGDLDDPRKGGHAYGTGRPGKSEFPKDWDYIDIREALKSVADHPSHVQERPRGKWYADGDHRGVSIKAVVRPNGSIEAGWPVKGPGVRRNPEKG